MFYLLLESTIKKLQNRVRRLKRRGYTDPKKIFEDNIFKKIFDDIMNLIKILGFLVRAKLISRTEKQEIVIYLNEASRGFMLNFVNDFMTECVPRQLMSDEDFDYLRNCTISNLEELYDIQS